MCTAVHLNEVKYYWKASLFIIFEGESVLEYFNPRRGAIHHELLHRLPYNQYNE